MFSLQHLELLAFLSSSRTLAIECCKIQQSDKIFNTENLQTLRTKLKHQIEKGGKFLLLVKEDPNLNDQEQLLVKVLNEMSYLLESYTMLVNISAMQSGLNQLHQKPLEENQELEVRKDTTFEEYTRGKVNASYGNMPGNGSEHQLLISGNHMCICVSPETLGDTSAVVWKCRVLGLEPHENAKGYLPADMVVVDTFFKNFVDNATDFEAAKAELEKYKITVVRE